MDHPTAGRVAGYLQRSRLTSDTSARSVRLDLGEDDAPASRWPVAELSEVSCAYAGLIALSGSQKTGLK